MYDVNVWTRTFRCQLQGVIELVRMCTLVRSQSNVNLRISPHQTLQRKHGATTPAGIAMKNTKHSMFT